MLLDLNLPDANGIDALDRIGKLDATIPIVVLTGLNDEHFGVSAVASGAQDYLVKGRVDPEMLRRAVLYAIERKRAELTAVDLHASHLRAQENARLERGLLPSPLLLENPGVDIVAQYRPSRQNALLGGDFYDFVQTPDRTVHVMIGDVAGHGPDEAALGVALRIGWRALTFAGLRGNERMRQLERILSDRAAEQRHLRDGAQRGACTRQRALHRGAGRASRHVAARPEPASSGWSPPRDPRSASAPRSGRSTSCELPEGHGLLLLTDGLFEGHSGRGNERLGEDGLARAGALAGRTARPGVRRRADRARRRVGARHTGGLTDDIAVVRVERRRPER